MHEQEKLNRLDAAIQANKGQKGAVMVTLQEAQDIFGYVPKDIQIRIAEGLGVTLSEVYGVATFYSQFSLTPKGEHQISVCLGTACYVKGADKVLAELEKQLGIKSGECTEDGLFSLDSCRCVGACGLAPVMMVDDEVYGKMTPDKVDAVLESYRKKGGKKA